MRFWIHFAKWMSGSATLVAVSVAITFCIENAEVVGLSEGQAAGLFAAVMFTAFSVAAARIDSKP